MIINELKKYYDSMRTPASNEKYVAVKSRIIEEIENFYASHPDISAPESKSRLHTVTAENFEPIIFINSPFFYEMGLRASNNWGMRSAPTTWFKEKKHDEVYSDKSIGDALFDFDTFRILTGGDRHTQIGCKTGSQKGVDFRTRVGVYRTPTPGLIRITTPSVIQNFF